MQINSSPVAFLINACLFFLALRPLGVDSQRQTDFVRVSTEISCESNPRPLSRRLVIQFAHKEDARWLLRDDNDQFSSIEDAVLAAYNELSFHACDLPHFRTIRNAHVMDEQDPRFGLQ